MIRPALLAVLLFTASPLLAQSVPAAAELQALDFYVRSGDSGATQAELRRLQLKYPGWAPPADLNRLTATAPSTEIDTFYRQLAAGQFEQARATLAAARAAWPSWTPPAEMTSALEQAEGQIALEQALKAGDAAQARGVVERVPALLRCDRINNAWRLAEAQQAADQPAAALGTYRAIAATCTNPAELAATLEKADAVATPAALQQMAEGMSARLPAERTRFEAVLQRLLAGHGATSGKPALRPAQPDQAVATRPRSGSAPAPAASAPRGETPAQCLARTNGARAATTVLQRAWCVYDLDRPREAVADFRAALGGRLSATQRRDGNYGLALAYLKLGMAEEASRIAAAIDFTRAQRLEVERQILDQRGVQAYRSRQYSDAIRYFDALEQLGGAMRRDLALLRAYAYLNSGDRSRAADEFRRLNNQLSTEESRRGLANALEN